MATQKERDGNWKSRGLHKRDFQHDHSGPEEFPHRKKKGKNHTRSDHKHNYDEKQYSLPLLNGSNYLYYNRVCVVCGRRKG